MQIPKFGMNRHKKVQRKTANWSNYQQAVFQEVAAAQNHIIVLAAPGSGKSTTIIESLYHIPENIRKSGRILVTAFNSAIVEELKTKAPEHVEVKTFHQIGFACVRKNWKSILAKPGYLDTRNEIAERLAVEEVGNTNLRLIKNLVRAMGLAKAELAHDLDSVTSSILSHGIDVCKKSIDIFARYVLSMMMKTLDKPLLLRGRPAISFDDMLWLPFMHKWEMEKYDRVFVDEAQDLSNVRTQLVLRSLKEDGKLFACADPYQSLYFFAGASPAVITRLQQQLNAKVLPLSVSYRLPKKIVNLAKSINPSIEHTENAIEGEIKQIKIENLEEHLTKGSVILSRYNFPLVTLAFRLIKSGRKVNIEGKDIGERLLWRIESWQSGSVEQLRKSIVEWRNEVVGILQEKNIGTERVEDEAECLLAFSEGVVRVAEVVDRIKLFFSNESTEIKLSSVHKSKGLEWNDVFILDDTLKHTSEKMEEICIKYVAYTRAKQKMVLVKGKL